MKFLFFTTRQHSTAEKIINTLVTKIQDAIISSKCAGFYRGDNIYKFMDQDRLIEILGNILTKTLVDPLYSEYQKLSVVEKKKKIRDEITDALFAEMSRLTHDFTTLYFKEIDYTSGMMARTMGEEETTIGVSFPETFTDEKKLAQIPGLQRMLSEKQAELARMKHESPGCNLEL